MYVMTKWLVPCRVRQNAMRNETGPSGLVDAFVAGVGYVPGRPLELIVGKGPHRYMDVPLRFFGKNGGVAYTLVNAQEEPHLTPEPRPRRVFAHRLPWSKAEPGTLYYTLTWDVANVGLLLIVLDSGEVVFWPPHKVSWGAEGSVFPAWLKRRYADDAPPLQKTRVFEAEDKEMELRLEVARAALALPDWRGHGIGLAQRYMPGPKGADQFRVHVWTKEAMQIGLESGIHDHRYDLDSYVVAGVLTQEEWEATEVSSGLWRMWTHTNDGDKKPVATDYYYDLTPRTLDIRCGQRYTFPRDGFHRSVPRSDVVVTVMERHEVEGRSHALCPRGVEPINGQTVKLPVADYIAQARKSMGV